MELIGIYILFWSLISFIAFAVEIPSTTILILFSESRMLLSYKFSRISVSAMLRCCSYNKISKSCQSVKRISLSSMAIQILPSHEFLWPIRAALGLSPKPKPSIMPIPRAKTFLTAPPYSS